MSSDRESAAAIEVDARGLRCPLPVIRLAEAAMSAPDGAVIVVLATDPAARHDIPAWCRMRKHELIETTDAGPQDGYLRFTVLIGPGGPQRSKAGGTGSGSARSSRSM